MRTPGNCGAPLSEGAATRPCPVGETSCGRRANLSIEREQWLARPIAAVFAFFGDATNLEAIMSEWLRFSVIITAPIVMDAGTLIEYRLRWRRIPLRWTTLIEAWEPPRRFVDSQLRGPYRLWHHTHTFSRSSPLTS